MAAVVVVVVAVLGAEVAAVVVVVMDTYWSVTAVSDSIGHRTYCFTQSPFTVFSNIEVEAPINGRVVACCKLSEPTRNEGMKPRLQSQRSPRQCAKLPYLLEYLQARVQVSTLTHTSKHVQPSVLQLYNFFLYIFFLELI